MTMKCKYSIFPVFSELLEDAPMLVIVTPGSIIQVNAKTLEPCSYHDLLGMIISELYEDK